MIVGINKQKKDIFKIPIDQTMSIYKKSLIVFSIIYLVFNIFVGLAFFIKAVSIFAVSIITCREMEILFYSHYKKANRQDAKEALKSTNPEITGMLLALILPLGTPLLVVAIGAAFAIFIAKLAFGGFTYNIFNPALAGYIFVLAGFPTMLTNDLSDSFFDTLLKNIFNNPVIIENGGFFGLNNFILVSILIIGFFAFLMYKEVIDYIVPCTIVITFMSIIFIMSMLSPYSFNQVYAMSMQGYMMFGIVFMSTEPITSPNSIKGNIIYGLIIGISTVYLSIHNNAKEAIFIAILFGNIFTPMINSKTKDKPKLTFTIIGSIIAIILMSVFYVYGVHLIK